VLAVTYDNAYVLSREMRMWGKELDGVGGNPPVQ